MNVTSWLLETFLFFNFFCPNLIELFPKFNLVFILPLFILKSKHNYDVGYLFRKVKILFAFGKKYIFIIKTFHTKVKLKKANNLK